MKITHILLATLFFLMSCTSSEQKSANETKIEAEKPLKVKISVPKEKVPVDKSTIDEAMRQLAKKAQNFTIDADKDKTIICAEGTKITLQANSLVDEKTGKPVQGKVNVQVTEYYKLSDIIIASLSTTSNDKLLETAGMINIEAFSNGKKLKLKDGATAQISFPTRKKKQGMKLFNGEWKSGTVNWVLSKVVEPKVEAEIRDCVDVRFEDATFEMMPIAAVSTVLAKISNEPIDVNSPEYKAFVEEQKKIRAEAIKRQEEEKKRRLKLIEKNEASLEDVNYYVLRTSQLAWINCDRFRSVKNGVDFKVEFLDFSYVKVLIVLKNSRSVIAAKCYGTCIYEVANMPLNEPITIVAIKSENGKTYIATKDSKITKEGESNLEFKLATLKELKKVLEGLDR